MEIDVAAASVTVPMSLTPVPLPQPQEGVDGAAACPPQVAAVVVPPRRWIQRSVRWRARLAELAVLPDAHPAVVRVGPVVFCTDAKFRIHRPSLVLPGTLGADGAALHAMLVPQGMAALARHEASDEGIVTFVGLLSSGREVAVKRAPRGKLELRLEHEMTALTTRLADVGGSSGGAHLANYEFWQPSRHA